MVMHNTKQRVATCRNNDEYSFLRATQIVGHPGKAELDIVHDLQHCDWPELVAALNNTPGYEPDQLGWAMLGMVPRCADRRELFRSLRNPWEWEHRDEHERFSPETRLRQFDAIARAEGYGAHKSASTTGEASWNSRPEGWNMRALLCSWMAHGS